MEAEQAEARPEFLVAESRAEPDRADSSSPDVGGRQRGFPFEVLFVTARSGSLRRPFRRDPGPPLAARDKPGGRGCLTAEAKNTLPVSNIGIGSVVEGVPFEHASAAASAEMAELANHPGEIVYPQLDFRFADRWAACNHGRV